MLAEYDYSKLENISVDIVEDAITLNMNTSSTEEQKSFNFETNPGQKEDIANLIASYSPAHQNWKKVGETKTNVVSVCTCNEIGIDRKLSSIVERLPIK